MAKDIAVLSSEDQERAISCLLEMGFSFRNPGSGEVSGWRENGREVFEDPEVALRELRCGAGIQLWRSADEDLFISYVADEENILIYFDGYTDEEAKEIQRTLSGCGIAFTVEYE